MCLQLLHDDIRYHLRRQRRLYLRRHWSIKDDNHRVAVILAIVPAVNNRRHHITFPILDYDHLLIKIELSETKWRQLILIILIIDRREI